MNLNLEMLMLRRVGLTYYTPKSKSEDIISPETLGQFQSDLFALGYVMSRRTYNAFSNLSERQGKEKFDNIIGILREIRGGHVIHVPLFRKFPDYIVEDSFAMWITRVVAFLFTSPNQECPICGKENTVYPLSPCGHWICGSCWDGSNYSACPICQRMIDEDDPFLKPAPVKLQEGLGEYKVEVLHLGNDLEKEIREYFSSLLSRVTPLSPDDKGDLSLILEEMEQQLLYDIPEEIPLKENFGKVFGYLLRNKDNGERVLNLLGKRAKTATDVLRVLCVYFDGEPDLLSVPKTHQRMSRPMRLAILKILENMSFDNMINDILRWPAFWIRFGEKLHPFDYVSHIPKVCAAFAILRKTNLTDPRVLSLNLAIQSLLSNTMNDFIYMKGSELRYLSWAGEVEEAFRKGLIERAIFMLNQRPGELVRRTDQVLRLIQAKDPDQLGKFVDKFTEAVHQVNPKSLISLISLLNSRSTSQDHRVFFPKGNVGKMFVSEDVLEPLPDHITKLFSHSCSREILERASKEDSNTISVVDSRLKGVIFPFSERSQSKAMVSIPRGSMLNIPSKGQFLRVFTHWMESKVSGRTDLDMSVAFYNGDWEHLGQCDYTTLSYPYNRNNLFDEDLYDGDGFLEDGAYIQRYGAIHSGDHQDAPPPKGSTEFIDLNIDKLRESGIRYVVVVIFSYNDVPFSAMDEAFSGYMVREDPKATLFDPRKVEQRFDLTSDFRTSIPMMVDLEDRYMRWLDMGSPLTNRSRRHSVYSYKDQLGKKIAGVLDTYYNSGIKMTLFELSLYHAVGRSDVIIIPQYGEEYTPPTLFKRREKEHKMDFFWRIMEGHEWNYMITSLSNDGDILALTVGEEAIHIGQYSEPVFASLYEDDIPVPEGSDVYVLRRKSLDTSNVNILAASDLISLL